jgi:hypothetical protein
MRRQDLLFALLFLTPLLMSPPIDRLSLILPGSSELQAALTEAGFGETRIEIYPYSSVFVLFSGSNTRGRLAFIR